MENTKEKKATSQKVVRRHVAIRQSNLVEKELHTKYNKLQLFIAKTFKLNLLDAYQYLYRVEYYGTSRLKANDIVVNSQGVVFVVLKESNRLAMIVSKDSYTEKPKVYGSLTLLEA